MINLEKSGLDLSNLPKHIAIIMDGNGRWAKRQGIARIMGHKSAVQAVRETIESSAELGVEYLTLYAFSTENWNRPAFEVNALMELLISQLRKETENLMKNNIRLHAIGDLQNLPPECRYELYDSLEQTKQNSRMTLTLALSYGGRNDIINAAKKLCEDFANHKFAKDAITEERFSQYLSTAGIPDPDLLIRTSNEFRISNFLLWELAYTEIYFSPKLWPDFRKEDLMSAIADYQQRERRFGKTTEQLTQS